MKHGNIPEKPDKQKDQISDLWDAVFNHIPTRLKWLDLKINFMIVIVGVILALVTASVILAVN